MVVTFGLAIFAVVLAAIVLWVAAFVLQVVAAVAANRGQDYQYPLTPSWVS
jgi:uncharacterized Tic20 family protein